MLNQILVTGKYNRLAVVDIKQHVKTKDIVVNVKQPNSSRDFTISKVNKLDATTVDKILKQIRQELLNVKL